MLAQRRLAAKSATIVVALAVVASACSGTPESGSSTTTLGATTTSASQTSTTSAPAETSTTTSEPPDTGPSPEEMDAFFAGLTEPDETLVVPAPAELQTYAFGPGRSTVEYDEEFFSDDGAGRGARFTWAVADRYFDSWDHHGLWWGYEPGGGPDGEDLAWVGYDPAFVQPEGWTLQLDACGSVGTGPITTYAWSVAGDSLDAPVTHSTGQCATDAIEVPAEGTYEVTLTVSAGDGWASSTTGTVVVDDILIVSLGDSSASGEGNPDRAGTGIVVQWKFDACHRSAHSSHARAARALEEADPHTSVTFLSFACSGATIDDLLGPYRGIAPGDSAWLNGGRHLPGQVDALARSLCADLDAATGECPAGSMRDVDVLLLQIGINDVHFKHILFACMNYPQWFIDLLGAVFSTEVLDNLWDYFSEVDGRLHDVASFVFDRPEPCHEDTNLVGQFLNDLVGIDTSAEAALANFPGYEGYTYGALRRRLADMRVRIGEVVAVTYPGPWGRTDGDVERGCGVFLLVNEGEAEWMHYEAALQLNQLVELEAVRNGWSFVPARGEPGGPPGVMDRFQKRGYCAGPPVVDSAGVPIVGDASYFVAFTESLVKQFNMEGTIHPNVRGHNATAQSILDTLAAPKPDRTPDQRVTIVFDSLRLSGFGLPDELIAADGTVALDFSAFAVPQRPWPSTTPPPEHLELFGNQVWILARLDESRERIRVRPDEWTSLPSGLTLRVDVAPSDTSLYLVAGSPDPGFVGPVTTALNLGNDPRLGGLESILIDEDPEIPGRGFPGYTEGGFLNILEVFSRLNGGVVSYGAGSHVARTTSSPGYFELRYCVFIGDIPRGIVRPGQQVFDECRVLVVDG